MSEINNLQEVPLLFDRKQKQKIPLTTCFHFF